MKESILSKFFKLTGIVTICYLGYYFFKGVFETVEKVSNDKEDEDSDFEDPSMDIEDFFDFEEEL